MGKVFAIAGAAALALVVVGSALANHAWGSYHWSRASNPFTLQVGDNVSSRWDANLNGAISDWAESDVLDLTKVCRQRIAIDLLDRRAVGSRSATASYGNNGLARHRADLGHDGQPHHPGHDEAQRHVLRQRAVQHVGVASRWSCARRSRTTSGSITRTRTSTIRTWARAWTTRTIRATRTSTPNAHDYERARHHLRPSRRLGRRREAVQPAQAELPERRGRQRPAALAGQPRQRRPLRRPAPGGHRITHVFWAPLG